MALLVVHVRCLLSGNHPNDILDPTYTVIEYLALDKLRSASPSAPLDPLVSSVSHMCSHDTVYTLVSCLDYQHSSFVTD